MARHSTPRTSPTSGRIIRLGLSAVILLAPAAIPAAADPWPATTAGVQAAALSIGAVNPHTQAAQIKAVQFLLTHHGIATTADGVYGAGTTANVKTFQSRNGLVVDGQAGPNTLAKLIVRTQQGQNGNNVRAVQDMLVGAHISVAVDGVFGAGTANAVKTFQRSRNLLADGIVGPQTWTALFHPTAVDCGTVKGGAPIEQTTLATNNIRVNTCFLSRTNAMVAAAARAGVTLKANSAWRSRAQQIALRKQNCGTTYYDIYQKPSSQCSPPTAIPGQSNHETGLAIDFSNAGTGGAVNNWLRAHAASYHFYNFPPEPWHWSWNGG